MATVQCGDGAKAGDVVERDSVDVVLSIDAAYVRLFSSSRIHAKTTNDLLDPSAL